jgi:hypothetical protein
VIRLSPVAALAAAAVFFGSAYPAVAQVAVATFDGTAYPTSPVAEALGGPATEARVKVLRGSVLLPLVLQGDRTTFVPRVSASRVGITPAPIDPAEPVWVESLYDVDLELVLLRVLSDRWRMTVVLAPGLAGDFRDVRLGHATLQGAVVFQRSLGEARGWGLGASVTNAFGEVRVVPVLAFESRSEDVGIEVLAPARASVFSGIAGRVQAGFRVGVDGNAYGLARAGTLEGGTVRYSVVDLGPAMEISLTEHLRLSAEGGLSLGRRLEVEDRSGVRVEDAGLRRGGYLRAGLAWAVSGER